MVGSGGRDRRSAVDFLPNRVTLATLREAARHCRGCDLYRHATQTVFGEGLDSARLMLVGETPGDREDLEGRPFVGPAGRLLFDALGEAGIERDDVYVTNVVKHFKWEARGRRRLHRKPNRTEIVACRPWLDMELAVVRPRVLVCLGATAAQALISRDFSVTSHRGVWIDSPLAPRVMATVHPSSILRHPDDTRRRRERRRFVEEMRVVAQVLAEAERRRKRRAA